MNPRVKEVKTLDNFQLHLIFTNEEEGVFDMKPWLEKPIFSPLRDVEFFNPPSRSATADEKYWFNSPRLASEY